MTDDYGSPFDQVDIAPELVLPDDPTWRRLMLCRLALEEPAGTFWEYACGEYVISCNETALTVPVSHPRPFEIPPDTAIVFGGGGVFGYINRSRTRLVRGADAIVAAIIEETCRGRAKILRAAVAGPLFAGRPVCEGCGVPLGEFPGDRLRPDRASGVCEQCLTFGRGWLNREPSRFA